MIFFEDFEIGDKYTGRAEYEVTEAEILEFGRRWDQAPYHTDAELARESIFGGLVAPGAFIIAIETWLLHKMDEDRTELTAALGRLGTDDLRFPNAVRPGDRISLTIECIDKRKSRSNPDRGIVTNSIILRNQSGEPVLTLKDAILVARKPA